MNNIINKTIPIELLGKELIDYSQEAISITKSFQYLKSKLPDLSLRLKALVGISSQLNEQNFKTLNDYAFKAIATTRYDLVRHRRVIIPKGMAVPFIDFIQGLDVSQRAINDIIEKTLLPAETYLGKLVNDPTIAASARPSPLLKDVVLHDIPKIRNSLSKLYSKDQAERREYEEVIKRQADVMPIIRGYNHLVEQTSSISRDTVFESLGRIAQYTDSILESFTTEGAEYPVSKSTIRGLGLFIHNLAQHVELYATHCFTLETLGTSIERLRTV